MYIAITLLPAWMFVGMLLPLGMWMSGLAALALVAVAHDRGWGVIRTTAVGLTLATAVTLINIL